MNDEETTPQEAVFAREEDHEPLAILQTWLVLEVNTDGQQRDRSAPASHFAAMRGYEEKEQQNPIAPASLIGVVAAETEDEVVKVVMAQTRRIGAYAIVPVTMIDFAVNVKSSAVQGRTLRLNP